MTYTKQNLTVPMCVRIEDATYEQYQEIYKILELYETGFGSEEERDASEYDDWELVGIDKDGDLVHWDEPEDYNLESKDIYEAQDFIDRHTQKIEENLTYVTGSENMRVVVYYTDGTQYTVKDIDVLKHEDNTVILDLAAGTTHLATDQIGEGVAVHTSSTIDSKRITIDTQHLAGYCVMRKLSNGMWNKSFYPLKRNFSVEASIANRKTAKASMVEPPILVDTFKNRLQGVHGTIDITFTEGDFEQLKSILEGTDEEYFPQVGDYVVNSELTKEEHDEFVKRHGTDPYFTPDHSLKYTYMGMCFINSRELSVPVMTRDVTHFFKGRSSTTYVPKEDDYIRTEELSEEQALAWWNTCVEAGFTPLCGESLLTKARHPIILLQGDHIMSSSSSYVASLNKYKDVTSQFLYK